MEKRQCLGLNRSLKRCKNQVSGCRLFCRHHKLQLIAFIFTIATGAASILSFGGYNIKSLVSEIRTAFPAGENKIAARIPVERHPREARMLKAAEVIQELRAKGLIARLTEADGYVRGGNVSGEEKALDLYRGVDLALSRQAHKKLEEHSELLLQRAEDDAKHGFIDDSVREYRALFAGIGYDDKSLTQ